MHKPAAVLENDTRKLLCDFDIQTDHLITARRQKKKRICKIVDFAVRQTTIKQKKYEKKDKYFDFARELKKTIEHESDNYTNCDWCFWYRN